jgi:hypothetical protein
MCLCACAYMCLYMCNNVKIIIVAILNHLCDDNLLQAHNKPLKTHQFITSHKHSHYSMQNPKFLNPCKSNIEVQNFGVTPKMCETEVIL